MLIQDDVRNSVVHLVVKQQRDGEIKGGHSRQKLNKIIDKELGYSFVIVN